VDTGATARPAALSFVPAAAATSTMPPPRLYAWVTPRTPPYAPPCPPLPRARQLELAGGTAMDVCRPHQEDRPAQGQVESVRYALATTGGDEPPQRAAPRYLRGCQKPAENSVLCAVVSPAGQVGNIRAWRRDAPSCDVRCVPPGAPPEALKSAADMPRSDSNAGATDHTRLNQAGSSQPWSVWGATVTPV
jgi:hypothetical protein